MRSFAVLLRHAGHARVRRVDGAARLGGACITGAVPTEIPVAGSMTGIEPPSSASIHWPST